MSQLSLCVWNVFNQCRGYFYTLINDSQCPSAPLLYSSIRNGSGEDRRACVQNRCGRRSSLFCGSAFTPGNSTEASKDFKFLCVKLKHILAHRSRGTTQVTGIWVQCREEMLRWSRRWIGLSGRVWKEATGTQSAVYMIRGQEGMVWDILTLFSFENETKVQHIKSFYPLQVMCLRSSVSQQEL